MARVISGNRHHLASAVIAFRMPRYCGEGERPVIINPNIMVSCDALRERRVRRILTSAALKAENQLSRPAARLPSAAPAC